MGQHARIPRKSVSAVLSAMRSHQGDECVQKEACGALRNIAVCVVRLCPQAKDMAVATSLSATTENAAAHEIIHECIDAVLVAAGAHHRSGKVLQAVGAA